ncbi:chorismate mutase [Suicoccus acidiformans]|uniref:chorismate mutase n=1 Tax=Suicoccus acidiformans TaxID=2036206 RepID=UPI0013C301A5|nr:chorismate mutase [Suicoccus acidiformans]
MRSLEELREEINQIDTELTKLIEARFKCAVEVAQYKQAHDLPVFDEKREAIVLERNVSAVSDTRFEDDIRRFYQSLMDISKDIQRQELQAEE